MNNYLYGIFISYQHKILMNDNNSRLAIHWHPVFAQIKRFERKKYHDYMQRSCRLNTQGNSVVLIYMYRPIFESILICFTFLSFLDYNNRRNAQFIRVECHTRKKFKDWTVAAGMLFWILNE